VDKPSQILGASFVIMFMVSGIGMYTFPVFLLPIEQYFGTSRTVLTAFGGLLFLSAGVASPIVGWAIHRWGVRWIIFSGAALAASGYLLLGQSSALWQLFVLGLPVSVGIAASAHLPNQTLISHWFNAKQQGRAIGIIMMASALGGVFWAPAAHELIQRIRWQGAYNVFGLAILVAVLPLAFFIRNRPPMEPDLKSYAKEGDESSAIPALREVLATRVFWFLFIIQFLYLAGFSLINLHLVAIVCASPLGLELGVERAAELGARVISYFLLLSIPGAMLGGWLADRYSRTAVMALQFCFLAASLLPLFTLHNQAGIYTFALLYGLGVGGSMVVFTLLLLQAFGVELFSRVMGLMGIAFTLGMAVGPVLGGVIYDRYQNYSLAFGVVIIGFASSALLLFFVKPVDAAQAEKAA